MPHGRDFERLWDFTLITPNLVFRMALGTVQENGKHLRVNLSVLPVFTHKKP